MPYAREARKHPDPMLDRLLPCELLSLYGMLDRSAAAQQILATERLGQAGYTNMWGYGAIEDRALSFQVMDALVRQITVPGDSCKFYAYNRIDIHGSDEWPIQTSG